MQVYCVIKATSIFSGDICYISEIHFDKKHAGPTVVLDPDIKNAVKFFGSATTHPTISAVTVMYLLDMYDKFGPNSATVGPYKGEYNLEVITLTNMDYVDDAIKQRAIDKVNQMADIAPRFPVNDNKEEE